MEKDLKELNSGKKGRGKRTTKINCSRECKTFKNCDKKQLHEEEVEDITKLLTKINKMNKELLKKKEIEKKKENEEKKEMEKTKKKLEEEEKKKEKELEINKKKEENEKKRVENEKKRIENENRLAQKREREEKVNDAQNYKINSLKHVLVKYKAAETPESKIEVKKEFENNPLSKVFSGEQSLAKKAVSSSAPNVVSPNCVCLTGFKVFLARVQDPSLKPEDSNYFNLVIALDAEADKKRKSADEFLDLMKEFDPESLAYIIYSLNQTRIKMMAESNKDSQPQEKKAKITE
ncbi:hypothetical protein ACTFIR_005119 [Dictyostelium discoideum]